MHLVRVLATSSEITDNAPIPESSFPINRHIYLYLEMTWDHRSTAGGTHVVGTRFYTGDQIVFDPPAASTAIGYPPYHLTWWVSGTHLGIGHHRIDYLIDGQVFASQYIDVTQAAPDQ
jgi:hypothetical protein